MASDIKIKYGSNTTITCSPASLATSATRIAGRECTAIDNTSNLYDDVLVNAKITVGTTPTPNTTIEIWAYACLETSSPTYPDTITGSDAAVTITNTGIKAAAFRPAAVMPITANTSDIDYQCTFSIASIFGCVPPFWGFFVTHDTGVALNSTAGNHVFTYTGIHYQTT